MGDDEKKEETVKSGNNKNKRTKEASRRQSDRDHSGEQRGGGRSRRRSDGGHSYYSGSYLSGSSHDSDASGHSGGLSDDRTRRGKRRRDKKRTRNEKTKHGRVAKPRKRSNKQSFKHRMKQGKWITYALEAEPEKALSITTIMTKASTRASSVTDYSNELCQQQTHPKPACMLSKEERLSFVREIVNRIRVSRNYSATKSKADAMETDFTIEKKTESDEDINEVSDT